jgi:hypothetical protein
VTAARARLTDSDIPRVSFAPTPASTPAASDAPEARYDFISPDGFVFARAELFPAPEQWGVRLADGAPELADSSLLRLVSRLLVWEAGCRAETIDVVLSRTHKHYALVRVGADYV